MGLVALLASFRSPDALTYRYCELFEVNVLGVLLAAHAARAALERTRGSIVITDSPSCRLTGGVVPP